MSKFVILLLFLNLFSCSLGENAWADAEETTEYWVDSAQQELSLALSQQHLNQKVARNVIMFLGDGMSIPTITAGRILKGQMNGRSGEETKLAMDQFQHAGLSKTYCIDRQVADSSSTATAYLCGVKTKYYTVGCNGKVVRDDCESSKGNHVQSILVDSYNEGKSTGIVTTTQINHATPSGTYAHSASRSWYDDSEMPADAIAGGCKDIAQQFVDSSHMITVALSGGRQYFQPNTTDDPEYGTKNGRLDGQDLIEKWKMLNNEVNAKYVWNKPDFDAVDPVSTDKLWGMFEPSVMKYEADRSADPFGEPSLAEMTEKAIRMLQKNPKGFFLLVEGGRIDHGHHDGNAYSALHDMVAFDDAIEKGVQMTSDSDTLIIVTADHSHTMSMGGYSGRGNDIFGLAPFNDSPYRASDKKYYTTLAYGNGPGWQGTGTRDMALIDPNAKITRENITSTDVLSRDYHQNTAVPLGSETHGGDDVAILARGPMSHLIHGVHEQSYIAHVMRYASCVGENKGHCNGGSVVVEPTLEPGEPIAAQFLGMDLDATDAEVGLYVQFALLVCLTLFCMILTLLVMKSKGGKGNSAHLGKANHYEL